MTTDRVEDRVAGGGVAPQAPTGEYSPPSHNPATTGEKRAVVKNVRGRRAPAPVREQSAPALQAGDAAAPGVGPASDLEALRDRQREDCRRLADQVERLRSLPDLGAGREGNQAAALGTLTRATAALHEMERAAYGLGQDAAQGRDRVILLPVPVSSMDEWARQAAAVMGLPAGQAPEQAPKQVGPRRAREE